nr:MAG TPA: hypothetical protein [Caudoviricetes sp.]
MAEYVHTCLYLRRVGTFNTHAPQCSTILKRVDSLASLELHSLSAHYLIVRFANKRSCND